MQFEAINPIVLQRADPWVLKHDGTYYFTGSYPEYDRIVLRAASTLEELQTASEVTIWKKHQKGELSHLIWAPELHRINGNWYIYFAAAPDSTPKSDVEGVVPTFNHRIFALECTDANPLTGTWTEKGRIDTGWSSFSLDATTFVNAGKQYLVWAQQDFEIYGNSNLYIAEMENPWTLRTKATLLSAPDFDWEKRQFAVNEGPAILQKEGRIYLTYSASGTGPDYAMGLLVAKEDDDLLDASSWMKEVSPVFSSKSDIAVYGPGHNSFTTDSCGEPLLIYHARTYTEIEGDPLNDPNRHAFVGPVRVSGGKLILGEPLKYLRTVPSSTEVLSPRGEAHV